jgi:hypothetical protein
MTMSEHFGELKALTRHRTRRIWEMAQSGGSLSDEDARHVQAMRKHPEYADLWGHLDELSDEQIERDGTNPIMHINIHTTIETQIADGEPKETGEMVEALMRQGLERHEAIPRVGTVLAEEIYDILKNKREFDRAGYVHRLKQLVESGAPRTAVHFGRVSHPRRRLKGKYR